MRRIQERAPGSTGLWRGTENRRPSAVRAYEKGPQRAEVISSDEEDEFATVIIFDNSGGGPGRTRICDLYRAKVLGSITYSEVSNVLKNLQIIDLDSIWTPRVPNVGVWTPNGLRLASTKNPARARAWTAH